jgi:Protein of unknown function (DUF1353)
MFETDHGNRAADPVAAMLRGQAMSRGLFRDRLVVSPTDDGVYWFTCAPFRYQRDREDPATIIEVPVGFLSDFTSTPRELWGLFPPWGVYAYGALIHDSLYWFQTVPRATADLIFVEAMEARNVPALTIHALYKAVSEFGQLAWDDNARRRAAGENRVAWVPGVWTKR